MYKYKKEALYDRALFNFNKDDQEINVAFEPDKDDAYIMIIFAEDGESMNNPHDQELANTLDDILEAFDNKRGLNYTVAAF